MKNLIKVGFLAFAFGLIFVSADSVSAQNRREARREYRQDVGEARRDYRKRASQGNYQKARREYREDVRDARREYRQDTGRRVNRRNYNRNVRRVYSQPRSRIYYRNGRRYVRNY